MLNITKEMYIDRLVALTNSSFTEEQKQVIYNFDKTCLVWADPGTGKTHTIVAGLFMAVYIFGIPANNIQACSFTTVATAEMSKRVDNIASLMRISTPRIKFNTIHSKAWEICSSFYHVLGMRNKPIIIESSLKNIVDRVDAFNKDFGFGFNDSKLRSIALAINSLNSSLTFDKQAVMDKMVFKQLRIDYDKFDIIRKNCYRANIKSSTIPRGETCLYALHILELDKSISQILKDKIKLLVIDESQDLSLLQLRLASLMCENLILIGDIKQQIFSFQGACPEVVNEFRKLYPDVKEFALSQSFRCKDEIAEFATQIIKPNNLGGENFKGIGTGGEVVIGRNPNVDNILRNLQKEVIENNGVLPRSVLFACRNNISLVPIFDALYRYNIPGNASNYIPIYEMPVIEDLTKLCELAINPHKISNGLILNKIIPEFTRYGQTANPIMKVATKEGYNLLQVDYNFRYGGSTDKLLQDLMHVNELNLAGRKTSDLFNTLWKSYNELYLNYHQRYLEQEPEYYIKLVALILRNYTFKEYMQNELNKFSFFKKYTALREGVKCYTFHSCKGLESNHVYLLDVDDNILPNRSRLDKIISSGCVLEAAVNLRNERNLLYVACTRAMNRLVIGYSSEPSQLLYGKSDYEWVNKEYMSSVISYADAEHFIKFIEEVSKIGA